MSNTPGAADQNEVDIYAEIEKRKRWFFECTLRGLNMDSFYDVNERHPNALLTLASKEKLVQGTFNVKDKLAGLVYVDNEHKVWSVEERQQRDVFHDFIGDISDWLQFTKPVKLGERIAALRSLYESDRFGCWPDLSPALQAVARKDNSGENLPHAMARIELCAEKPWLISALYLSPEKKVASASAWIKNAESFIDNFEKEWLELAGLPADTHRQFEPNELGKYQAFLTGVVSKALDIINGVGTEEGKRKMADLIKVAFKTTEGGKEVLNIRIDSPSFHLAKASEHPFASVKYWAGTYDLKEIYLNAANSDMGLCLLMRSLYLYGNLPTTFPKEKIAIWRTRKKPDEGTMKSFINNIIRSADMINDGTLMGRAQQVIVKLDTILSLNTTNPYMPNVLYSPVNSEVYKQALLRYKFWIDEPFHAFNNHGSEPMIVNNFWEVMWRVLGGGEEDPKGINKARVDMGKDKESMAEMEYWSENHYIMFASSEYLAGQLWEKETFQPVKDFLSANNTLGVKDGAKRKERGKWRVLRWLNNKLMFGWTEFNSSGYYREHLYGLLNLVDFSLDEEVQRKAALVTDLLFFDIVRFLHKSSMGACGGRSQFHSKNSGWDNALGDVIEMMLGERGIYSDNGSHIGMHFATSTYKIPAVLLEIARFPPEVCIDRSRVSIAFDEAPKYGFTYSYETDKKKSLEKAYRTKLDKHSKHLKEVNDAIAREHDNGYAQKEEDTLFWWSQSAFYNKEVILNTFHCVEKFKLFGSLAFKEGLRNIVTVFMPLVYRSGMAAAGGMVGLPWAVGGWIATDIFGFELDEAAADQLSFFLEGSTRSRANIYTYRNRDIMLSGIMNFRPGQLNFQSNVSQATISTETNVFTTSPFPGFRLSNEFAMAKFGSIGAMAGLLGGPAAAALAIGGAGVGAIIGLVDRNVGVSYANDLGDHNDGPGWWSGYWALPMIVQHENAAIIIYQFNWLQNHLTDAGSHAWFPAKGFDEWEERRTGAYDDDNFPLFESPGKRGYWLFGKKIHRKDLVDPEKQEEAYIAVFSNQDPEWQDKGSDFYQYIIKEKNEKALKAIREKKDEILDEIEDKADDEGWDGDSAKIEVDKWIKAQINSYRNDIIDKDSKTEQIMRFSAFQLRWTSRAKELIEAYIDEANHVRIWANPLPEDYFVGKDWYADRKNIWIIQVGNKKEYGSYENFKNRIAGAKVTIDDLGDLECTYHIPKPDGSTQKLTAVYDDREFSLDGTSVETDFFPRFENCFIRGGFVEWGQREYVIEYRGKRLLHRFPDLKITDRTETVPSIPEDLEMVKGLVIYIKTLGEDMDEDSVALATVTIGCTVVAKDELVAAGEIEENTEHDVEWIYFDTPGQISPDMTIVIEHPPIDDGDDDPEWEMSFELKALMGDYTLRNCSVHFPVASFEGKRRTTLVVPFSIQLSRWQTWKPAITQFNFLFWQIAALQPTDARYYDHLHFFAVDATRRVLHGRMGACDDATKTLAYVDANGSFRVTDPFSLAGICLHPDDVIVLVATGGSLFINWQYRQEKIEDRSWVPIIVQARKSDMFPATFITIPLLANSPLVVRSTVAHRLQIFVAAADNHFYSTAGLMPGRTLAPVWRRIATNATFTPLAGEPFEVAAHFLFALDAQRHLWVGATDYYDYDIAPDWKLLNAQLTVSRFTVFDKEEVCMVIINDDKGAIWAAQFSGANNITWERVGGATGFTAFPDCKPVCARPVNNRLDIFVVGQADGKLYTNSRSLQQGWAAQWKVVDDFGMHFENKVNKQVVALNRVVGQTELYTVSDAKSLWRTWWS